MRRGSGCEVGKSEEITNIDCNDGGRFLATPSRRGRYDHPKTSGRPLLRRVPTYQTHEKGSLAKQSINQLYSLNTASLGSRDPPFYRPLSKTTVTPRSRRSRRFGRAPWPLSSSSRGFFVRFCPCCCRRRVVGC